MDATIAKLIETRPALPTVDDIPGVQAVQAKLAALRQRQDRLAGEIREALAAAPTAKASAAERLYAGLDADEPADPGLDARLAELRKARRITADAIALGEAELKRIVRRAAPALLADLKRWHRGLVVEAARLLVGVQVLAGAELAVLRELESIDLPAGDIAELQQLPDGRWFVERLIADGVLDGNEDWVPDHLRPEKPGVAAAASSMVGSAIDAVRRAVGGKPTAKQAKPTDMGGHELWQ